ncbi:hypothetical protein AB838_17635 [Rhodobacteraceae bacterium (ex Bugula neritina AB1)]|nr:hypothetical protein AB838_17635 [Rhodobacteraceae bacterium (ex Bugula neritina AB1)]
MPYNWTRPQTGAERQLHLWPHQSLAPKGYVRFIALTSVLICMPLVPLLGSFLLWGLLPFLLLALFGMKWALDRSRRDHQILEVLTLTAKEARLERINPDGSRQNWKCNRYWTRVEMHGNDGPVPHYVTLQGSGREVEIGAFLSEEERLELYGDLKCAFSR